MIQESFFQKVACGLLVCKNDPYSTIVEANDAFYMMVGYTKEEIAQLYQNRFAALVLDDLTEILEKVFKAAESRRILDYEYRIKHKSDQIMWIHDVAMYDPELDVFNVVIMDITYKEKALEQVTKAAAIDKATGLLTRAALENHIKKAMKDKKLN